MKLTIILIAVLVAITTFFLFVMIFDYKRAKKNKNALFWERSESKGKKDKN